MKQLEVNSYELIEAALEDLDKFFITHKHVYIYGAGIRADYIFKVCKKRNYDVEGFITTKREKAIYYGLKVLNLEEGIKEKVDGIIPGFKDFSRELLGLNNLQCDCLDLDNSLYDCFFSIFYKDLLDSVIPKSNEIKSDVIPWDNILVIRIDAIGDLVCTTPLFREIKRNYPSSRITLLCQRANRPVVEDNKYLDEIITIEGDCYRKSTGLEEDIEYSVEKAQVIIGKLFNKRDFDRVILPMHIFEGRNANLSLALALLIEKKKIMSWIQLRSERSYLYPYIISNYNIDLAIIPEPKHEVDNILEILIQNGLEVTDNRLDISCKDNNFDIVEFKKTKSEYKYVAVGIVGSEPKKNWPAEKYNNLFMKLNDHGFMFVLLGGLDAAEAASKIDTADRVINLVNKLGLKESMQVINECDCYVGSNTGLMHIASGLGKPCVTIYAASKDAPKWDGVGPTRWGVRDTSHVDILLKQCLEDCVGSCKKTYSHCINQISVDEVKNAILDLFYKEKEEGNKL